jgi:hypothetical protein
LIDTTSSIYLYVKLKALASWNLNISIAHIFTIYKQNSLPLF